MMLKIGFTGTSRGMTPHQIGAVRGLLAFACITEKEVPLLGHGDCIGADARADAEARRLGMGTVLFPPDNDAKRAFCPVGPGAQGLRPPKPYLVRSHDIVDWCNTLIAAPGEMSERLRSGTWATVRYARQVARPHVIVWPSGDMEVV